MDDLDRLRLRRAGFTIPDPDRAVAGTPRILVKVVSVAPNLAVGTFFLANPVVATGAEVEGGVGTFDVDTTRTIAVYPAGPGVPATGDLVVARFVDHRWVAVKRSGAGTPPIMIGYPGCLCSTVPGSVGMAVEYGEGEDAHTYGNAYQSCTFQWYTATGTVGGVPNGTYPGYMPFSAYSGAGYYSSTAWVDDYGFTDYFRLSCFSTQWTLGVGQYSGGLWQSPGQIYGWTIGGRPAVNFCSPFQLHVGHTQQGIYFNGQFLVG